MLMTAGRSALALGEEADPFGLLFAMTQNGKLLQLLQLLQLPQDTRDTIFDDFGVSFPLW